MNHRLDYQSAAPKALRPLFEMGRTLAASGLTKEATALGEPVERIMSLSAWRETSWYSERERIAFEWTESLVKVSHGHPDDTLPERARSQFSDAELVYLTLAVATITAWNQLNVAFGTNPELAEAAFHQLHPNGVPA